MSVLEDHVFFEYLDLDSKRSGVRIDYSKHRQKIVDRRHREELKIIKMFLVVVLTSKWRGICKSLRR